MRSRWLRRAFRQLDDGLVRNLPAERRYLLLLAEVFLEEDGFARIGCQRARRRKQHASRAVIHLDPSAEKTRILSHVTSLYRGEGAGNGTRVRAD